MSERITISEGGADKLFSPAKLKTRLATGGECLWVPKSSVNKDSLSVTKNGTYRPAASQLYAFGTVSVNVTTTDTVVGKGKDGNTYMYKVDEDGYLVETIIDEEPGGEG